MTRLHRLFAGAAGLSALVAGTLVAAAPAAPPAASAACAAIPGPASWHRSPRGEPEVDREQQLAQLKADLHLSDPQQAVWAAFATLAATPPRALADAPSPAASVATPERMAQHLQALKQRVAHLEALQSAMASLYAALSPEQRAVIDRHPPAPHDGDGHPGRHPGV